MQPAMLVNHILRDEITKLNYNLVPPGFRGDVRLMHQTLSKIIDNLGEMSATAQGLNKVITTTEKLRNSPTHILYLLKDANSNNNGGQVIGLLKVGHKKLFLYDRSAQVLETQPLCVLDFFVLRERQRHGYGKQLFDHMLQDQGVTVTQLAIDGPSEKMITFMRKNYVISNFVRQANNFAVAPEFFQHAIGGNREESTLSAVVRTPSSFGRCAASKPFSSVGTVIHGAKQHSMQKVTSGMDSRPITSNGRFPPIQPRSTIGMVIHGEHPQTKQTATTGSWYNGETARHTPQPDPASVSPSPVEGAADVDDDDAQVALAMELEAPVPPLSMLLTESASPVTFLHGDLAASAPGIVPVPATVGAGATHHRRDSQLTDQGFFDVKFYHNKIW